MTPIDWALVAIVTLAFTVEAAAGFGATVITVSLGANLVPIEHILATFVPVNVVLSLTMVARHREDVDTRILRERVLAVMAPGMLVGMALFSLRGETWIKATYGAFVIALAARELFLGAGEARLLPRGPRTLALLGAGVIQGLFASGGPLLVYAVGGELTDKARFRATLASVWAVLNGFLLVRYVAAGTLTPSTLRTSATFLVPLLLGLALGHAVHERLDAGRFRRAVFALLLFAGLSLTVRGILGV